MEPVEGSDASGAASAFDGNHTNDIVSWMFSNELWEDWKWASTQEQLMHYTELGHLAWVVFPPPGFRI